MKYSVSERHVIIFLIISIFFGSGVLIYRSDSGNIITVLDPSAKELPRESLGGSRTIFVDVTGEVANPGVYELPEGSRVFQAIEEAGGVTEEGDTTRLNMAKLLRDAERVYVYKHIEDDMDGNIEGIVNINTASQASLQNLPGIGPHLAQRIIDYRNEHGVFTDIVELIDVPGIGSKIMEDIIDKITIY